MEEKMLGSSQVNNKMVPFFDMYQNIFYFMQEHWSHSYFHAWMFFLPCQFEHTIQKFTLEVYNPKQSISLFSARMCWLLTWFEKEAQL